MGLSLKTLERVMANIAIHRHKLVLICGVLLPDEMYSFSKQLELPMLNLNLHLSKKLIEIPIARRPFHVNKTVEKVILSHKEEFVFIYNIELLFHPQLQSDPLALLEHISRSKGLVVKWPGGYNQGILSYAVQAHLEYKRYTNFDGEIISL